MLGIAPFGTLPIGVGDQAPVYPTAGARENVWILTGLLSDAAVITTIGAAPLMPAANLQDRDPTLKYRADGRYARLIFTFPGPTRCNALYWGGHNHTPGGVLRCSAGDTLDADGIVSPVELAGWQSVWPLGRKPAMRWPNWPSLLRWTNTNGYYPYYQIDVADPGAGITNVQAGRAMLGLALQTRLNVAFGAAFGSINSDFRRRSSRGRLVTGRRLSSRTVRLPFSAAEETEADAVNDLYGQLGTALDLVVALDPAATDRLHRLVLHGTLAATGSTEAQPFWSDQGMVYKFELPIEEF